MSDEEKSLEPKDVLKRIVWRSVLGLSGNLEQYTTWTVTGVAAIVGLFISHLDSIAKIVSVSGLRSGLILFAFALVFGVISKQLGMAAASGLDALTKLDPFFNSSEFKQLLRSKPIDPKQLTYEMAEPFLWPLSRIIRKGGLRGAQDPLSGEKLLIRRFCVQLYFVWLHGLCSVTAIITIALSIKK